MQIFADFCHQSKVFLRWGDGKTMDNVDRVEISLPVKKEYAKLLRLAVAGIASRMNFDYDSLEDLKIGIEEAYLIALENAKQEKFNLIFEIHPSRLEILIEGLEAAESFEEEQSRKFGFSILDSVMDEVKWTDIGGVRNLRMAKIFVNQLGGT